MIKGPSVFAKATPDKTGEIGEVMINVSDIKDGAQEAKPEHISLAFRLRVGVRSLRVFLLHSYS